MDLREHQSTQQRHPWEVSRFRFLSAVLADQGLTRSARRVLDAGAGDAWFSQQLTARLDPDCRISCWDAEYTDDFMTQLRSTRPDTMTFSASRPAAQHDLILLLDVLEHVQDDRGFLRTLVKESLAPGGWLLFSVPAWPRLFSAHDTWLHHFRRYTPAQARGVLQESGLRIAKDGGLFHSLLAPRLATVMREKLPVSAGPVAPAIAWNQPQAVTRAVEWVLAADNQLSRVAANAGIQLPGLSYWAVCQRQS